MNQFINFELTDPFMVSLFLCSDVQRLSSLYDATKSKLMENETHSQVLLLLHRTVFVLKVKFCSKPFPVL